MGVSVCIDARGSAAVSAAALFTQQAAWDSWFPSTASLCLGVAICVLITQEAVSQVPSSCSSPRTTCSVFRAHGSHQQQRPQAWPLPQLAVLSRNGLTFLSVVLCTFLSLHISLFNGCHCLSLFVTVCHCLVCQKPLVCGFPFALSSTFR